MIRLVVVAFGAIGLILLVAFIAARLVRARTAGMSIRMQIFLALAGIVGAFGLGVGLLVLDRIEARATLLATEAAHEEARAIAGLVAGEVAARGVGLSDVARTLELASVRPGEHLALLGPGGQVLFPAGSSEHDEPGTVTVEEAVMVRDAVVGAVRVVKPTIVMRRLLEDFAPTILVISLVLGAAAALAAALIGRAIATPIEGLTAFAVRVSEGDTTAAPPVAHGREVQRLTASIDSMRRELEGRPFVEMFAADLSHELKNPVAAIRASAEVLDEGAVDEPAEARRFVRRIREATARIEALLDELLKLARIEARGVETPADVDLAAAARAAVEGALDRGAQVELRVEGDTVVRGDAAWLARAVENLVDNAVVHGEAGRPVRVTLRREGGQVVLAVTSAGAVPPHVRARLFRRFVTTRADRGGTGLGLAIVRAVAASHGGRAELVRPGPPEVEFRLRLPAP